MALTEWCAPIVVAPKKNSDQICMCVDLSKLNRFVCWECSPSITPAEVVADMTIEQVIEAVLLQPSTLMKLFATIPLSSYSCERSASTLWRLNTYLRCTLTEDLLSSLALINNHYETDISIDNICKLYSLDELSMPAYCF